jgi:hypothetical protein
MPSPILSDLTPPESSRSQLPHVPIGQNGFQPLPITRPKPDLDVAKHAQVVHQDRSLGNLLFRSDH